MKEFFICSKSLEDDAPKIWRRVHIKDKDLKAVKETNDIMNIESKKEKKSTKEKDVKDKEPNE